MKTRGALTRSHPISDVKHAQKPDMRISSFAPKFCGDDVAAGLLLTDSDSHRARAQVVRSSQPRARPRIAWRR
jgi:hypothetical protein